MQAFQATEARLAELKGAAVRKARAAELWYYWATIPFDIQEPFFTLDTGRQQFIVNIITAEDNGTILWIDVVGDLAVLAARPN